MYKNVEKEMLRNEAKKAIFEFFKKIKNIFNKNKYSKERGSTMLIEEKIEKAKQIQLLLEEPIDEFKITRITELNADYLLPVTDKRGLGGVIIADDGTYMICGSAYSLEFYIEKFKDGKRDDIEKYKLYQLIEENSGPDPFWADSLKNYFKTVNKTSKEKLEFFSSIIVNNTLFNEFAKETVKPTNPDEIFEKYKTMCVEK